MANFLNNCLIQLFDIIEEECNIKFVTFTDSQVAGNTETNKIQNFTTNDGVVSVGIHKPDFMKEEN